jgi:carbon-monoxide dehydrogenase iron sulfur subunit
MKVLVFDPELCDGCGICQETCSQTWFKVKDHEKSAIRISEDPDRPGRYLANNCNQCGECIDVCPTLALKRDKRGIVRINKKTCVGCLSCVGFCPILAMRVHADSIVPFKCVACGTCAKACPTGALSIEDLPDAELTETEKRMKVMA